MQQNNSTHYGVLKVTRDAPAVVIQAAFKALIQLNHPDNFQGREDEAVSIALSLREACDILINPSTRAQYDRWLDKQHLFTD
jgi:DnaJ-class molecular chaperone